MPWSTRDRHVGGKVGQVVFITELGHLRHRKSGLGCFGEARSCGFGLRNEHPDVPIALLAGVAPGVDAVNFEVLIGRQRRNHLTLSGMGVEPPAVVAALHLRAVELPAGKRHAPVRAGVMQDKRNALGVPAQNQRRLKQRGFLQCAAMYIPAGPSPIPEAVKHQGIGCLGLRERQFCHGWSTGGYYKQPDGVKSRWPIRLWAPSWNASPGVVRPAHKVRRRATHALPSLRPSQPFQGCLKPEFGPKGCLPAVPGNLELNVKPSSSAAYEDYLRWFYVPLYDCPVPPASL